MGKASGAGLRSMNALQLTSNAEKMARTIWDVIVTAFGGNLDLLVLATPLVRKHCFRDLEEVGICSFR